MGQGLDSSRDLIGRCGLAGRGPSYPLRGAGRGPWGATYPIPISHITEYLYTLYSILYILFNLCFIYHIIYIISYAPLGPASLCSCGLEGTCVVKVLGSIFACSFEGPATWKRP